MATFKQIVERYDGEVRTWRQGRFLRGKTFGRGGVCGPLAAKWIKECKQRGNFGREMGTLDGREEVTQLKLNQCRHPNNYVKEYLQLFGLSQRSENAFTGSLSINRLAALITSSPGYYFVGFSSRTAAGGPFSGHALAVDMFQYKFFDPNVGQASFQNAQNLKSCFTTWFRVAYMDLQGHAFVERYLPVRRWQRRPARGNPVVLRGPRGTVRVA